MREERDVLTEAVIGAALRLSKTHTGLLINFNVRYSLPECSKPKKRENKEPRKPGIESNCLFLLSWVPHFLAYCKRINSY